MGRVYHRPGARGYQALYAGRLIRAASSVPLDELHEYCEARVADAGDPTPAYDPDLERFDLTAKGRAALDAPDGFRA